MGFRLGRIRRKGGRVQLRRGKCRILRGDGLNLRWWCQRSVVRPRKPGSYTMLIVSVDATGFPSSVAGAYVQERTAPDLSCPSLRNHARVEATRGIGNVSCFAHVRRNEMRRLFCLTCYRLCRSKHHRQHACGNIENSLHRCNPQGFETESTGGLGGFAPLHTIRTLADVYCQK